MILEEQGEKCTFVVPQKSHNYKKYFYLGYFSFIHVCINNLFSKIRKVHTSLIGKLTPSKKEVFYLLSYNAWHPQTL